MIRAFVRSFELGKGCFNKMEASSRRVQTCASLFSRDKSDQIKEPSPKKPKRVKLYPGFQKSTEEIRHQLDQDSSKSEEIFAKKIIEDFYGLNELEYESDVSESKTDDQQLEDQELSVDNLVRILKNEKVQEICCIQLPDEINYCDFMLLGTCLSDKHLNSSFISLNRKYKQMMRRENSFVKNRVKLGKESSWCAIDLGKIVVHLFLPEARGFYDLEGLWTCGAEFDEKIVEFKKEQEEMERRLLYIEVPDDKSNKNLTK